MNNVPKKYNGRTYHSTLEANYAELLDEKLANGVLREVQAQPTFRIIVNKHHICDIKPDFFIITADGQEQIHEVKGYETDVWRLKWKLMQAIFPDYKYYVIKKGDF